MGNPPPVAGAATVTVTPTFKLVFASVLGLTVVSLLTVILLAVFVQNPSDQVKAVIETCSTTFKMGFGAIVGLIGGKAL